MLCEVGQTSHKLSVSRSEVSGELGHLAGYENAPDSPSSTNSGSTTSNTGNSELSTLISQSTSTLVSEMKDGAVKYKEKWKGDNVVDHGIIEREALPKLAQIEYATQPVMTPRSIERSMIPQPNR